MGTGLSKSGVLTQLWDYDKKEWKIQYTYDHPIVDPEVLPADKPRRTNKYLRQFERLRCNQDVLTATWPKGNKRCLKEITETMAVFNRISHRGTLVDLCAGHCMTAILAAHFGMNAIAVEPLQRKGNWKNVHGFVGVRGTIEASMNLLMAGLTPDNTTFVSIHPCGALAKEVITAFALSEASHLVLMPCCHGDSGGFKMFSGMVDNYTLWCQYLAYDFAAEYFSRDQITVTRDSNVLSPKNIIIQIRR